MAELRSEENKSIEAGGSTVGTYDTAQICLNGHSINANYIRFPAHNSSFCNKCGAEMIIACPKCKSQIRGDYHTPGVFAASHYRPPAFCHQCGAPYPWTAERLVAARQFTRELEKLDEKEKDILSKSLDDLIRETPNTPLAATHFKKLAAKSGVVAAEGFKSILIDILSEAVKKQIGLH
jgi:hypothetical protein